VLVITFLLTPWSRVLLQKLTGFAARQEIPRIMEPESSLPYSQVSATCPYPEPAPSGPHIPSDFLKINIIGISQKVLVITINNT
jgi:hypothetical protein